MFSLLQNIQTKWGVKLPGCEGDHSPPRMSGAIPPLPLYVFMVCTCSTFIKSKWMANSLAWLKLWGWNAYCEYQRGKKHNISNHNVTFFWMFSVSDRIINIWDRHAGHYAAIQDDIMPSGSLLSLLWGMWVAEGMHICAFVCEGYRPQFLPPCRRDYV